MESKIDLSQVSPVNHKITVVLVNQFCISTIQFLNKFSSKCEEKLRMATEGINRVNAGLELLEAKLNSIPFLNSDESTQPAAESQHVLSTSNSAQQQPPNEEMASVVKQAMDSEISMKNEPINAAVVNKEDTFEESAIFVKLKDDLRFSKYFKMLKMGVPCLAVKGKMSLEGVDADVLDMDPESPAPPGAVTTLQENTDEDSDD